MLRDTAIYLSTALLLLTGPVAGRASRAADPEFKIKDIPLSDVYTTRTQPKLKHVRSGIEMDSPEAKALEELFDAVYKRRPKKPFVAVVRGDAIKDAVVASARAAAMKDLPKEPLGPTDGSKSKKYWVLVHLGNSHSGPLRWLLSPPQQAANQVRVCYSENDHWPFDPAGELVTLDSEPYLYWIPVEGPKDGAELSVELVCLKKTMEAVFPKK